MWVLAIKLSSDSWSRFPKNQREGCWKKTVGKEQKLLPVLIEGLQDQDWWLRVLRWLVSIGQLALTL
jgi:hypothetical protein